MTRTTVALAAVVTFAACSDPGPVTPETPAQFTTRGRWPGTLPMPVIGYRIETDNTPIDPAIATRAIERAIDVWNQTRLIRFQPVAAAASPDLSLGWRRGHHGACQPFGPGADIAHAGPVKPGTFIHFDLGRTWDEESVFSTALHELGHVLGLGHSEAETAVMSTNPERPTELSADDLAGLQSLYGNGDDQDATRGDVRIGDNTMLRRVAPPATSKYAVFDSDGDGDDELLVWRTDAAGHGALMIYHFTAGPELLQTFGPFPGAVAADADVRFAKGSNERYLICRFANGNTVVRQFDRFGIPVMPTAPPRRELIEQAGWPLQGDVDGDGRQDRVFGAAVRTR